MSPEAGRERSPPLAALAFAARAAAGWLLLPRPKGLLEDATGIFTPLLLPLLLFRIRAGDAKGFADAGLPWEPAGVLMLLLKLLL